MLQNIYISNKLSSFHLSIHQKKVSWFPQKYELFSVSIMFLGHQTSILEWFLKDNLNEIKIGVMAAGNSASSQE